jgi:hypothetical protein
VNWRKYSSPQVEIAAVLTLRASMNFLQLARLCKRVDNLEAELRDTKEVVKMQKLEIDVCKDLIAALTSDGTPGAAPESRTVPSSNNPETASVQGPATPQLSAMK